MNPLSIGAVVTVTQRKAKPRGSWGEEASQENWYIWWVSWVMKRGKKDILRAEVLEE